MEDYVWTIEKCDGDISYICAVCSSKDKAIEYINRHLVDPVYGFSGLCTIIATGTGTSNCDEKIIRYTATKLPVF